MDSYAHRLLAAVRQCEQVGFDIRDVEADLGQHQPRPHTRAVVHRLARGVQKAARSRLSRLYRCCTEDRLRHKLERWDMPLFPRLRASRALQAAQRLSKLVPPRVVAAVIRTWFNGWCTRRRFQ